MKITLIQSGGFSGQTKIAEEELADWPEGVQAHIQQIFAQQKDATASEAIDPARDKEYYTLEMEGKRISLQQVARHKEIETLIQKMKGNLQFKKQ